jgi:hypothetical protein
LTYTIDFLLAGSYSKRWAADAIPLQKTLVPDNLVQAMTGRFFLLGVKLLVGFAKII